MRIQKLPKILWTEVQLNDQNVYCFWYEKGIKKHAKVESPKIAMQFIQRADKKRVEAFASCYIAQDKQHEVICYGTVGRLAELNLAKNVSDSVMRAQKLALEDE